METYDKIKEYLKIHGMTKAKEIVKAIPDVTEVTVRVSLCKGLKLKELYQPLKMHYALVTCSTNLATAKVIDTEQPKV